MKKLVTILLVVLSISFVGCSSGDSSGDPLNDGNSLKFTYKGQIYNFEPSTGTSLQKVIVGSEDVNDVITTLFLEMPENPSVGTFSISNATPTDANLATLHGANLSVNDISYRGKSGTLKIISITPDFITGTFNFTGENQNGVSVEITNGSFKAFK